MPVTGNNSLSKYRLSIRVYAGGFSFLVTDVVNGTEVSNENFVVQQGETLLSLLQHVVNRPSLTEVQYQEVQLLMDTPSTRVPLEEFRRDEALALYRLTFGVDSTDGREVRYEILPSLEVAELFSVDAEVEKFLLESFPQAKAHGFYGYVLEQTSDRDRQREGEEACLYVSTQGAEMFLFSYTPDGRLRFANAYPAKTVANQLYFLLYVWKTLGMDQRVDACVLVDDVPELREELKKYIQKIE